MKKTLTPACPGVSIIILAVFLAGCSGLAPVGVPTLMPVGYMPTAIALTLEAQGVQVKTSHPLEARIIGTPPVLGALSGRGGGASAGDDTPFLLTQTPKNTPTRTPRPTLTPTRSPSPTFTLTPTEVVLPPTPTSTPPPEIPEADIQIYRLGDLSRVTSPIALNAYLTTHTGANAVVELRGEDGRLLVRQVREFNIVPWKSITIQTKLEFEIAGPAEVGRLIIGVQDANGRTISLNSVNLILLSTGETELNPVYSFLDPIFIQEPRFKALIQGGTLMVTGYACPNTDLPLRIELVTEEGKVVGQRLAAIGPRPGGGYAVFSAEVPYTVTTLTPVRVVVYEVGEVISPMTHLSSVEVVLSP